MVRIYQINIDRDKNDMIFRGSHWLEDRNKIIDFSIYDLVYEGNPHCSALEDIFHKFNIGIPEGHKGRSLSVSDIVELVGSGDECGFYFCDSFGWKKLKMSFTFN